MRFKNYLLKDEKVNIFRSLQIKLVNSNTGYSNVADFVSEKYNIQINTASMLSKSNTLLREHYKGKYKFDLCLNEGIPPDDLKKLSDKQLRRIKREWYKVNDEFAKIQKMLEKHLQDNVGGI